jgi:hypothetical protein
MTTSGRRDDSSDYWEGLVYCESCGGYTLHAGFQLPDWWRFFRVAFLPLGRRRYCVCRRCANRQEMRQEEEEAIRATAQERLALYLSKSSFDEKSVADQSILARIEAEWSRPPLSVEEAERELGREGGSDR